MKDYKKEPKIYIKDKTKKEFLAAIEDGMPIKRALTILGIGYKTWCFWTRLAADIKLIQEMEKLNKTKSFTDDEITVINTELSAELTKKPTYASDIVNFIKHYEEAKTKFIQKTIQDFKGAQKSEWQKYAWLLERSMPDVYGKPDLSKNDDENARVSKIEVQYVDPISDKKRLEEMTKLVEDEILGKKEKDGTK